MLLCLFEVINFAKFVLTNMIQVRTITFRFTNIADAVAFRGSLLRDPEWEYSNLQFVTDPCEKATGVHFD